MRLRLPVRSLALWVALACPAIALADPLQLIQTTHYTLHTDLDRSFADSLGQRMDAMWDEYARRLENFPLPDANKKFDAYLFAHKIDYMKLTGDRLPNTGGVFNSRKQLLAAFLEDQGCDGLRRTLQHEAFHQFADKAIGAQMPVWLNEGLAQIFEEGIWTGDRFVIGQAPPRRVALLQEDRKAGRLVPFREFLMISDEQWISRLRERSEAISHYNQAWAMAQFLVYASDHNGKPLYASDLIDMLELIHHGCGGRKAFELAFSDNYSGFEARFNEWADTLTPSAQAAYSEQQDVLADMMVQLYGSGRRFESVDDLRQFLIAGGFTLQSAGRTMLPDNCFCDLEGRIMSPDRLFFASRGNAPTPDLICRPTSDIELRTHFSEHADVLSYETILLSP